MKRTGMTLAAVCMLAFGMAGCEDGPAGPHPDLELSTRIPRSGSDTADTYWTLGGKVIMSGDSVVMIGREFLDAAYAGNTISLSRHMDDGANRVSITIKFSTPPTEPGEYPWKTAKVTAAGSATVTDGASVGIMPSSRGQTIFYAVSGKTVITKVHRTNDGLITGYEGYFNGKLRASWPNGFIPTIEQMFPPGFDISNPTLVGRNLTIHSGRFNTVPPVSNVD